MPAPAPEPAPEPATPATSPVGGEPAADPSSRARTSLGQRLVDLAIVALAFVIGGAALVAFAVWRIGDVGSHDNAHPVGAIVVLGAAQYDGRPSPILQARLDHAILLYEQGYAPYLVVTGGKLQGDRFTEAATGRAYAIAHGVPSSAILAETTGGSTLESMRNVRALLEAHDIHTAVFVSDRTHMLRVLRMAADQGIEGWGSPTQTSPTDLDPALRTDSTIHELGAMGLYLFFQQPGDR